MPRQHESKGKLVILSGPSGVGKSTVIRRLMQLPGVFYSVSMTTRAPGKGELHGRDYWFVSRPQFEESIRQNALIEYAQVHGEYYGTPRSPVEKALEEGRTVLLEIDVQGGRQVMHRCPGAISVFLLPPRREDLAGRISQRGRGEDQDNLRCRLLTAEREIAEAARSYHYQVVNDNLDRAVQDVIDIIHRTYGETK